MFDEFLLIFGMVGCGTTNKRLDFGEFMNFYHFGTGAVVRILLLTQEIVDGIFFQEWDVSLATNHSILVLIFFIFS